MMGSGIHDAFSRARPALLKEGYAVVDGAIDANSLNNLHQSMCCLTEASGLRPHRFGFRRDAQSKAEIYFKPHILEAEVEDESVQNVATHLKDTLEQLDIAGHAASAFPDFKLKKEHGTVKLQCNEGGGGCFPMHYDNAGPPNRRKLTCLVYLNPEWKEKDGGQLVLYPWLSSESCVAPLHGRIVLFRSDTVCHRVLPCHARRFCITVWLEADDVNNAGDTSITIPKGQLTEQVLRDVCLGLKSVPAQRLLSRAVYAEEYEHSLTQSMRDAPQQLGPMLAAHKEHVDGQSASGVLARLVACARAIKAEQ